ncbi:MAG: glycosyltransferase family 2 protein, partial [Bacteroidota bacterium]
MDSTTLASIPSSVLGVVGVVVIHYQHPAVTQQCLDALAQQQGVRIALRLVDNSKDGDAPAFIASDNFHSFHRLRGENHGFSHA